MENKPDVRRHSGSDVKTSLYRRVFWGRVPKEHTRSVVFNDPSAASFYAIFYKSILAALAGVSNPRRPERTAARHLP